MSFREEMKNVLISMGLGYCTLIDGCLFFECEAKQLWAIFAAVPNCATVATIGSSAVVGVMYVSLKFRDEV